MQEHPNYDPGNFRGFRESLSPIEERMVRQFVEDIDSEIDRLLTGDNQEDRAQQPSVDQLAIEAQALASPTTDSIDLSPYDAPIDAPSATYRPLPTESGVPASWWDKVKKSLLLNTGRHVKRPRKF